MISGIEELRLGGSDFDDSILLGRSHDMIEGNGGNDTIDGGAGIDTMEGGSGDDHYFVDKEGDRVIESSANGFDTVTSKVTFRLPDSVEGLTLDERTASDLAGFGNRADNLIMGDAGDNRLSGRGVATRSSAKVGKTF